MQPDNKAIEVFVWLGFVETSTTDSEYVGTCPFCGKGKFYINRITLQWSCKVGHCGLEGNVYTFIACIHELYLQRTTSTHYQRLERDRWLPEKALRAAKLAYYPPRKQWFIPVFNEKGAMVNIRIYSPGKAKPNLIGLPKLDTNLYGLETLSGSMDVVVTEGEWDVLSLRALVATKHVVLGVPGSVVFKDEWANYFAGKNVYLAYDADVAGIEGRQKATNKLRGVAKSIWWQVWPDETPDGYDQRDFYVEARSFGEWSSLFVEQGQAAATESERKTARSHARDTLFAQMGGQKPAFEAVLDCYRKHLTVTDDYEAAIRTSFAVVLSKWLPGDPLWMYLVGPPSSGKTIILVSLADCDYAVMRSNLTPASLVSGFRMPDGRDPSLLPLLNDKVFILKDFTEVLKAPPAARDEIYSTLRGAYDGSVERQFGNGITRIYLDLHFSMLAGVTPDIYSQREASLGERFLMLHVLKGGDYGNDTVLRALDNVGKDTTIMDELATMASLYLNDRPTDEVLVKSANTIPDDFNLRIAGLAQLAAILRSEIRYDFRGEVMLYRPQYEVGARLAKQLRKLALSLALLEEPVGYAERVSRIVTRVALDTCVGFNLEVVQSLARTMGSMADIHLRTGIPLMTVRKVVEDLAVLGALDRVQVGVTISPTGAKIPDYKYTLSRKIRTYWDMAKLG